MSHPSLKTVVRSRRYLVLLVLLSSLWRPALAVAADREVGLPPAPLAEADVPAPAPSPEPPEPQPLDYKQIYEHTLAASVWILNRGEDGQIVVGTGWVVDADRRLIITNEHVIELNDDVFVFFPEYKDGKLQTDKSYYMQKLRPIEGTAIDSDTVRDLALIQVESLPEGTQALELASESPAIADHVHSVGAAPEGSEGLWIYSHGRVRSVVRRTIANGHQVMTVESDMPTNRGNSGGAVVNDKGQVVAVVEGHMGNARLVSLYIDVSELRGFLDETLPLIDPQTAADFIKRGKRHLGERRYLWAVSDFTEALNLNPELAEANSGRGWGFYHEGDYQTALADFNEAIRRDSNLVDAHHGRGLVYRQLGNNEAAIADFTNAVRLDPMYADSYNERGVTYYGMQQYASAEADFTRALERNDEDAQIFANRGDARQELGRHEEAIEDLLKAIELDPTKDAFVNLLGISLHRLGRYEQAAAVFYKATQMNPQNATYHSNLGDALQRMGNFQEAILPFTQAIRLNNQNGYYFASRAWSYQKLENYRAALADYDEAIRLQSNVAWYFFRRAEVHASLGNQKLANKDYRQASRLDPDRYSAPDQQQVSTVSYSSNPVAGRWRFRGRVSGVRVDVRAHLSESGNFAYVWRTYTGDGRYIDTTERGTYTIDGSNLVFSTSDGSYAYPYAAGPEHLTIHFTGDSVTITFAQDAS